jgi:chromosome segregation ATPase
MIAEGSLGGYWRWSGSRMTFYVYCEDLENYLRSYGPLNGRKRRHQSPDEGMPGSRSRLSDGGRDPDAEREGVNELRASLAALTDRVSALEDELERARGPQESPDQRQSDLEWERRRRLELEDALAALEADEALVAEADALNQKAYVTLRSAHQQLRASIARARQPRTVADLPRVSGSGEAEFTR